MANLKKKRNKKQTQLLLALLGAIIAGGGLFLFLNRDGGSGAEYSADSTVLQANIERRNKAVEIRRDLFDEGILNALNSYVPIQPASIKGRANPFVEYIVGSSDQPGTNTEPSSDEEEAQEEEL